MNPNGEFWRDRVVLVTGHTGFKGGWLTLWLHRLGAKVHGYALDPPTEPSMFGVVGLGGTLASDSRGDLVDGESLRSAFKTFQPEVVIHLAAQPLVRSGYADPIGTWTSNLMGTAQVLEAARAVTSVRAMVLITTDKVYDNREWAYPYREVDPLGGKDPYSASKAAAELLAASYRASFFSEPTGHGARVATARAGNVVGGGDWGQDRLLPDCIKAFSKSEAVRLRYPQAVRPWQHVLEPLAGYLLLAEGLASADGQQCANAWNFGPDAGCDAAVGQVAEMAAGYWGGNARVEPGPSSDDPPEAGLLRLDSTLARAALGWKSRWSLGKAIEQTVAWHKALTDNADMRAFSLGQIDAYLADGA